MFTGIIQQIGEIKSVEKANDLLKVTISYKDLNLKDGDSVCVEGICSTVKNIKGESFDIDYMPETLNKTTAANWKVGTNVNLESSLTLNEKINGHFVTGHIDKVCEITKINELENTKEIKIKFPKEISKYLALKGSVTIDGTSLTISLLEDSTFSVSLVPYTIEHTTLGNKKVHDKVNIEIDIISRYLERLFNERDKQSSYQFLYERGFI